MSISRAKGLNLPTHCLSYTISLNILNQTFIIYVFLIILRTNSDSIGSATHYAVLVKPTGQYTPTFWQIVISSSSGSSNTFFGFFHSEGEDTKILRNGPAVRRGIIEY